MEVYLSGEEFNDAWEVACPCAVRRQTHQVVGAALGARDGPSRAAPRRDHLSVLEIADHPEEHSHDGYVTVRYIGRRSVTQDAADLVVLYVRSGSLWPPVDSVAARRWSERQRSGGAYFACIHLDARSSDQRREVVFVPNDGPLPPLVNRDQRGSTVWTNCPEVFDHAELTGDVEIAAALTTALREAAAREGAEDYRERDIALFGDDDEDEEEADEGDLGLEDEPELAEDHVGGEKSELDEAQKELVMKVHVNAGHPEKNRFLRMLKVGGASRATLQFAQREFVCDQCHSLPRPRSSRKVAFARTFQFNVIIGVDLFYLSY